MPATVESAQSHYDDYNTYSYLYILHYYNALDQEISLAAKFEVGHLDE